MSGPIWQCWSRRASRLAVGTILVLSPLLAPTLAPTPAAAAPEAGTLRSDPAVTAIVKEQVVLTGTLPAGRARPLTLQRRMGTGSWTNVGSGTSTTAGAFTFTVTMPSRVNSSVNYRVLAPWNVGSPTLAAVQTPVVNVRTVGQTALLAVPATVPLGSTYQLAAVFGPARPGRPVVFERRNASGTWTEVARRVQDSAGSTTVDITATALGPVVYRARTTKFRNAPQVIAAQRTLTVVPDQDVTPPPVPSGLNATAGDRVANLEWDPVVAPDLDGYRLYLSSDEDGPWARVAELAGLAQTVGDLANGTALWFAVSSVDRLGNESQRSPAVSVTPADLDPPPPVTLLSATPGDAEVSLAWTASDEDASFRVLRAGAEDGPYARVADGLTGQAHTVGDLENGTTYWFRVAAVDPAGNQSEPSEALSAAPRDTTAPAAPAGLDGEPRDRGAGLTWDPVMAPDLAGYRVYRGVTADGPWQQVTGAPFEQNEYAATGLTNGATLWWAVTAVDSAGNESSWSDPVAVTPADTTPPGVPQSPWLIARDRMVSLSWGGEYGPDFLGNYVYIATSPDGPWARVSETPGLAPYDVTGLTNGTSYWFSVSAVDVDGNESARSEVITGTPNDNVAPPTPTGLVGSRADVGVELTWDEVTDDGLVGYHVFRSDSADADAYRTQLNWDPTTETQLVDDTAAPGTTYWYQVASRDQAGNYSPLTDKVRVDPVAEPDPTAERTALTSGTEHSCRIKSDGTLWCWGRNLGGELGDGTTVSRSTPVRVGEHADWVSVSASAYHTCGIRAGGSGWCWGEGFHGALGHASTSSSHVPVEVTGPGGWAWISAGYNFTCGIKVDGTAWCWGDNASGQLGQGTTDNSSVPLQVGTAADWVSLSAGVQHVCGIRADHSLWCWGPNSEGELGVGDRERRTTPQQVGTATWREVDTGWYHTCGVRLDGSLWCWGWNAYGSLGDSSAPSGPEPRRVGTASDWVSTTGGLGFNCALRENGSAWCWGLNRDGRAGDGTLTAVTSPVEVAGDATWTELAAGAEHGCGLREDGSTWCWGLNNHGQIASAPPAPRSTPHEVDGEAQWLDLSTGNHSCGVRADHTVWCWGSNGNGQIGTSSDQQPGSPRQVGTDGDWSAVSTGAQTTCALRNGGSVWCWGWNGYGQVGDGTTTDRGVPTQVGSASDWRTLETGVAHVCGIRDDGTAWCWGANYSGQLGDGTTTNRLAPAQVGSGSDWTRISAGSDGTCGIRADGSLWCWGSNFAGQLGDGTTTNRPAPVPVGAATGWASVSVGSRTTCATRVDGSAWCWGANYSGQLGDGTTTDRTTPVQVGTDLGWIDVAPSAHHTCGTRGDGSAWCWGDNSWGQLGDGSTTASRTPVQVGSDADWAGVTTGDANTCGVRTDGGAWCWGANYYGQLGDGSVPLAASPVRVLG